MAEKFSVYSMITDRIIAALEAGTVPWKKPWTVSWPKNFASKHEYSGVNVMLLAMQNRTTPYWLTFKQVDEKKGKIKKGEKGTTIVFTSKVGKKEVDANGEEKDSSYHMLRYYYVWNLDQTEGIEIPVAAKLDFKPIERCEQIVSGYQNSPKITHEGDRACYSVIGDYIHMPPKESFIGEPEYYSTLFHEMTHSTRHKKRLSRFEGEDAHASFGSESYSKEELIAELGASFLIGEAGISGPEKNSESYIAGWLSKLKGDKKFIISAASKAQASTMHILGK